MTELKVCYKGEVNRELDLAIEKALGKLGYERWASGYSADNVRDLAFDKTKEEEMTLSATVSENYNHSKSLASARWQRGMLSDQDARIEKLKKQINNMSQERKLREFLIQLTFFNKPAHIEQIRERAKELLHQMPANPTPDEASTKNTGLDVS